MALERYGGVFMMELLKKHIHMNRRRGNVTSQMTLDDDFNVPDSMDDVEELILENGEYYRLFTSMFLHFGIEHLFGNMLTLIFLGELLEKRIGKFRVILIYILGGLAGNLLSLAKEMITGNYAISAGASGAIFAVLGALVFLVVRHRGKLPGTSGQRLAVIALLTLADGFVSTGVDYMAHLGGMAAGFVLAAILVGRRKLKVVPSFPEE